jgi:hypothetical protein
MDFSPGSVSQQRERATLIFQQPREAQKFAERVAVRAARWSSGGVVRRQEAVAEELTVEFDRHGETVSSPARSWEHTADEQAEARQLADMAFTEDLPVALARARASDRYPQNIDLMHGVLTGALYMALFDRLRPRRWSWPVVVVVVAVVVLACWLIILVW